MSEGISEAGMGTELGPAFPQTVRTAGIIWVVIGCLILLNAVVNLLTGLAAAGNGGQVAGGGCGALFGLFVGAVFVHVGRQTLGGKAPDTLGNGIGSLIFAAGNLGFGALLVAAAAAATLGGPAAVLGILVGLVSALGGVGLLVAGVLALVGRGEYRAWRQAQKARRAAGA